VTLVHIAFGGAVGFERPPAVVISTDTFSAAGIKLIVAAITSSLSPPLRRGDTLLGDWSAAALLKPSAVRGVLVTVDKSDVVRKLEVLTKAVFARVQQRIAEILGLLVPASTTSR